MTVAGEIFVAVSPEAAGFAKKLERQLQAAGLTNVGTVAGVALAVGIGFALTKIGSMFEDMHHQIEKETGATGAVLDGLGKTAVAAFKDVPVSLGAAATAVDELFRRGVPLGPQLDALAKQELFLAKITKEDLGGNVEATTALMARFNIPLGQQSRELDVLFKAQQRSGKGFGELASNLQSGGLLLQSFGFNLDQSTALIANLEKHGANLSPVLAGLRLAFGKITGAGGDPKKVLADLIAEFSDGTPRVKAAADAINLFGKRSGAEMVAQLERGAFVVGDLLAVITNGKDGIDATGFATLSLGDKFTLLKNRILVALQPISEFAVTAVIALLTLTGPFKVLRPFVDSFVNGIIVLSKEGAALVRVFDALTPGEQKVVLGLIALTAAAFAFKSVGLAQVINLIGTEITGTMPWLLAIGATIAVIGLAVKELGSLDQGKKQAEAIRALSDATVDASGRMQPTIATLAQGFTALFTSSSKAISPNLPGVIAASGSNIGQLSKAVTGGATAWGEYYGKVIRALDAAGNSPKALAAAATALDRTRAAVILSARADIARMMATGGLTQAMVDAIQKQATLKDGSIDYGRAIELATAKVISLAAAQRKNADAAATSSVGYRDLVRQFATGALSEAGFTAEMVKFGFAAADAKTKTTDVKAAIDSFVGAAVGALPTIGAAISSFSSDIATATSTLQSDLDAQVQLQERAGKSAVKSTTSTASALLAVNNKIALDQQRITSGQASNTNALDNDLNRRTTILQQGQVKGSAASAQLADDIIANNKKIHEDYIKVAHANDPATFTASLVKQSAGVQSFQKNLTKLLNEGLGPLAGELAKQGPAAAGALAQGLADAPAKAVAAEKAVEMSNAIAASYKKFIQAKYPELANIGKGAGVNISAGIAGGIRAGTPAVLQAVDDMSGRVVAHVNAQWRIKSPSQVAHSLGSLFGEGLALGLESAGTRVTDAARTLSTSVTTALTPKTIPLGKLIASGLTVSGQAGAQRADAQQQQSAAHGVFAGATIQFPDKTDPKHLAAELAWSLR